MARTKGARGKKNVPTNKLFIDSLKQLSDKYLKRLDVIANNPTTPDNIIIKAAALVIGETMVVMKHENYAEQKVKPVEQTNTPVEQSQESSVQNPHTYNPLAPIVDFSLEKKAAELRKSLNL